MHPVLIPVAPYRYLLPNLYFSVADIANPDLVACGSWTGISLDIARFYEEHCQPSSGSAWPACPTNGNRAPIAGGGMGRHNLHRVCQAAVTALPRVCCVVWNLNVSSFSSSKLLAARFNQQFNTSKLGRHTSSSETRLVTRDTRRKSLEMAQTFTTDLVRRAIKSCRNSKAFGGQIQQLPLEASRT